MQWLNALAVASALFLAPGLAHAASYTYTGNAGFARDANGACNNGPGDTYNWYDPKNWGPPCLPAGPPGAGDTAILNAPVHLNGSVTVANLQMNNGRINFGLPQATGSLTVTGTFDFAGYSSLTGLTLNLPAGATFNFTAVENSSLDNTTINNFGTFNYQSPGLNIYWGTPGTFNNKPGAIFNDASSVDNRLEGGSTRAANNFTFNNEGTYRKTGTGTMEWSAGPFNNSGTVDIQNGTLLLYNGGTNSGTYHTAAGAVILLNNAPANTPYSFSPTSLITGPGQVRTLLQPSANVATGTITVDTGAKLVVPSGGALTTGTAGVTLVTRNGGLVECELGSYLNGTVNLAAGSHMDIGGIVIGGTVNNSGIINWMGSGSIGNGTNDSHLHNLAASTLNVLGTGALLVPFSNAGTVNIGTPTTTGTLIVTNYTQTASGVLNVKIGGPAAGTQFDQLTPSATANLGGTLNVRFINGFTPANGDAFKVVYGNGATVTGTFAQINTNPSFLTLKPTYDGHSATATLRKIPAIASLTPLTGLAGTTITLTGSGFTGATAVKFNSTNAPEFTVLSDTRISVQVPVGATSGVISVTTPGGTGTSLQSFAVLQAPTITGFTPISGPVGTEVTISGTHLSGATVTLGTKAATIDKLISTDTRLVVTVPVGAVTSSFKVTTPGGIVISKSNFTVTTGDSISGHVYAKGGKTPLRGARVFLVKNSDLAALLSSASSPDIVSATTDATGAYKLPGQVAGTYIVTPVVPGTTFTSARGTAPVSLAISSATTLDFTATLTDSSGPTVTLATPLATPLAKDYAISPTATGTINDSGSGPLAVVVGLYRFQNGAIVGIYDWRAQTFVAANSQDPGVFKTVVTNGPNWTLTLPALAPSSYRISVIGVNKAFKAGTNGTATAVSIARNFSLSGGGNATDSSAPTASITQVNGLALSNVPPGTSALTVSSLLKVEGTSADNKGGSGIAKVNLYIFRNLKTVISLVAYSAEFWNGTSWVSVTVSPLSKLSALPSLSTTLGGVVAGGTSWSRTTALPQDNGNYYLAAVATDKVGNVSDYLTIITTARTITVKAAPKSIGGTLSTATPDTDISGRAILYSGNTIVPVSGALITISGGTSGSKTYTTRTATDGTYVVKGLTLGTYSVTIASGNAVFNPDTKTVTLNGGAPAATNVDFSSGSPGV